MKKQFVVLGLGSFGASVAVTLQRLGRWIRIWNVLTR